MLPSAKKSLQDGGFKPKPAAWILIGCFLGGAIVIQLVSRILHHHMPTQIVDCEHSHDEEAGEAAKEVPEEGHGHEEHTHPNHDVHETHPALHDEHAHQTYHDRHEHENLNNLHTERPKNPHRHSSMRQNHRPHLASGSQSTSYFTAGQDASLDATAETEQEHSAAQGNSRRPSLPARLSQRLSNITNMKSTCECDAPCYGFTEPCGTDCFKKVQSRGSYRMASSRSLRRGTNRSIQTLHEQANESTPLLQESGKAKSGAQSGNASDSAVEAGAIAEENEEDLSNSPTLAETEGSKMVDPETSHHPDHHHHVPQNAFLSIGLQTSIAIALHKLPEGFITYATNHANPKLGFSVFLALFIHNITEGFALALPLYLAINSRWKAMAWSFVLGGCSQPLGAGVAALWFKIAGNGNLAPGEGIYGGMFAVTAGIMASVALQLFSESLDLTHNRGLCMIFAFVGMGILGVSSALTA